MYVPPLGKLVKPKPRDAACRAKDSCFWIWAVGAVAALVLGPGTWWLLQSRANARDADRANQVVAVRVDAAREELSQGHSDKAAALLQTALATENATHLEEAQALWTDIRSHQAAGILRAAESALAKRDAAQALSLLESYLEDDYGTERTRAANLKEQLERAISDEKAVARLRALKYESLAEFARTGTLSDLGFIEHPDLRAIHLDKLRGCLATELRQRQEDQHRRALRIQATPVFGEFRDFVMLTRGRIQETVGGGDIDYRLLDRLFRELNVNNQNEQQQILTTLSTRPFDFDEAEKVARMRANFKERFRADTEFDKTDWEIFDRAVDQEMNKLLNDLQGIRRHPNEVAS
jgi:hypothetical protein